MTLSAEDQEGSTDIQRRQSAGHLTLGIPNVSVGEATPAPGSQPNTSPRARPQARAPPSQDFRSWSPAPSRPGSALNLPVVAVSGATIQEGEFEEFARKRFASRKARQNREALEHRALFIFGRDHCVRNCVFDLVHHRVFEGMVITLIFANCLFLAMEDPTAEKQPEYMTYTEFFFMAAFALEMLLKVFAMGFIMHPGSYLRNGWNRLDFIIVIMSVLGLFPFFGNYSAIRTLRVLRPLRSINGIQGLKNIVNGLLGSVKKLVNVLALGAFVLFIFGILGIQLWAGKFSLRCQRRVWAGNLSSCDGAPGCGQDAFIDDPAVEIHVDENRERFCKPGASRIAALKLGAFWGRPCDDGYVCVDTGTNPNSGYTSFDNFLWAFLSIFQCLTMEGWVDIMYITQDVWGSPGVLYFITMVVLGAFFILNLALAVINEEFDRIRQEAEEERWQAYEELHNIVMMGGIGAGDGKDNIALPGDDDLYGMSAADVSVLASPTGTGLMSPSALSGHSELCGFGKEDAAPVATESSLKECWIGLKWLCFGVVHSPWFAHFIVFCIVFNTVLLALEHHDQPQALVDTQVTANLVLTVIFALEMVLKLLASGFRGYIEDRFNILDGLVVILSIVELSLESLSFPSFSVFRAFRLLRLFKLLKNFPELCKLIKVILSAVAQTGYLNLIIILYLFIAALVGMQFFGGKFHFPERGEDQPRATFNSFGYSVLTVFTILTRDDWVNVMWDAMDVTSVFSCGYFILLVLFGDFLILNLFLAILIGSFDNANQEGEEQDSEEEDASMRPPEPQQHRHSGGSSHNPAFQSMAAPDGTGHAGARPVSLSSFRNVKRMSGLSGACVSPSPSFVVRVDEGGADSLSARLAAAGPGSGLVGGLPASPTGSVRSMRLLQASPPPPYPYPSPVVEQSTPPPPRQPESDMLLVPPGQSRRLSNDSGRRPSNDFFPRRLSNESERRRSARDDESAGRRSSRMGDSLRRTSRRGSRDPRRASRDSHRLLSIIQDGVVQTTILQTDNADCCEQCGESLATLRTVLATKEQVAALHRPVCVQALRRKTSLLRCHAVQLLINRYRAAGPPSRTAVEDVVGLLWEVGLVLDLTVREVMNKTLLFATTPDDDVFSDDSDEMGLHWLRQWVEHLRGMQGEYGGAYDARTELEVVYHALHLRDGWSAVAGLVAEQQQVLWLCSGDAVLGRSLVTYLTRIRPVKARTNGGNSLALFGPSNSLRLFLYRLVKRQDFDFFILVCICASSLLMATENPRFESPTPVKVMDYTFTGIFVLEMLAKIIAFGLLFGRSEPDPPYLMDSWNVMDGCIVVISLLSIAFSGSSLNVLKVFRTFRALRPLRVVARNRGLRMVVVTLIQSLRSIGNVALISLLVFLVFGILGVQLFSGTLRACSDPEVRYRGACRGWYRDEENTWRQRFWRNINPNVHYDDIRMSLMTLFEISTLEMWSGVMWAAADSVSSTEAPIRNNRPIVTVFFVIFVVVGAFFILNLFVGVVIYNYNEVKSREDGLHFLTRDQKLWIDAQRMMLNFTPVAQMPRPSGQCRQKVHDLCLTESFEAFIGLCILLNIVVMATEHNHMSDNFIVVTESINRFFSFIFLVEATLKLTGFGLAYFQDSWNRFDFFLVIISVVGLAMSQAQDIGLPINASLLRVLRIFRIMRILRLVRGARDVRILLETVWYSLPSIANIGGFLLLLFFIYAVLGVNLFALVKRGEGPSGLTYHANFENFPNAALLLFRIVTGENWNAVMHDTMVQPPLCGQDRDDDCGLTWQPPIFYITFLLMAGFVLTNLFVAIILDNFATTMEIEKSDLHLADLHFFLEIWSEFDPTACLTMATSQFPKLLAKLGPPLGISKKTRRVEILKRNQRLGIPEHGGMIHFIETIIPLARHVMSRHWYKEITYQELRDQEESWRLAFPDINNLPTLRIGWTRANTAHWFAAAYIAGVYRGRVARLRLARRRCEYYEARLGWCKQRVAEAEADDEFDEDLHTYLQHRELIFWGRSLGLSFEARRALHLLPQGPALEICKEVHEQCGFAIRRPDASPASAGRRGSSGSRRGSGGGRRGSSGHCEWGRRNSAVLERAADCRDRLASGRERSGYLERRNSPPGMERKRRRTGAALSRVGSRANLTQRSRTGELDSPRSRRSTAGSGASAQLPGHPSDQQT